MAPLIIICMRTTILDGSRLREVHAKPELQSMFMVYYLMSILGCALPQWLHNSVSRSKCGMMGWIIGKLHKETELEFDQHAWVKIPGAKMCVETGQQIFNEPRESRFCSCASIEMMASPAPHPRLKWKQDTLCSDSPSDSHFWSCPFFMVCLSPCNSYSLALTSAHYVSGNISFLIVPQFPGHYISVLDSHRPHPATKILQIAQKNTCRFPFLCLF